MTWFWYVIIYERFSSHQKKKRKEVSWQDKISTVTEKHVGPCIVSQHPFWVWTPVCPTNTKNVHYSTAVSNRIMCFSDISSAIILFALVCIAHMLFHLFSVQNNIPFAKFSPGYGEIQRFQVPFTDLKLTSALELLSNWKWILSVSAWVMDVVAEVEGLTHSILCASAKKTVMTTSNFYFISAGKELPELWTCETFWFGNTSEPVSEKTGKFCFVKFNLNRSIQKESFLADSAVEPLEGSS